MGTTLFPMSCLQHSDPVFFNVPRGSDVKPRQLGVGLVPATDLVVLKRATLVRHLSVGIALTTIRHGPEIIKYFSKK